MCLAWGVLTALLVGAPAGALADTVWTVASGPNAKPFERKGVKIDGMSSAGLLFRSASADRAAEPKPIKEIWRIQVDDEPALNAAETAFVAQKWDDAVNGYQKTLSASRKDWVKQYATLRLLTAAEKSGKFSAAASAYAALVQRDPKAADDVKPEIPANAKAELPGAINAVKAALADGRAPAPARAALQAFLAELYIANGQLKEAQAMGGKGASPSPSPTPGGTAAVPAAPRDPRQGGNAAAPAAAPVPSVNKGEIDLKLQLALASLKEKKYQEAIDGVEAVAPALTDPEQQATALFALAEARAGAAGDDPAKLKDAALSYMRVVAHFKGRPDTPHVAESLLRTGTVLEQAKLLPDALAAYQAVQTDFKQSPHAKEAAAGVARVRKAIEESKG